MRLGIDLGTTRTIVAASDRGNYPVVGFMTPSGELAEYVPTITASREGELVHGHAAAEAAREGHPHLRSWKRLLARHGPSHEVVIGPHRLTLLELARDFLSDLADQILSASNLPGPPTVLPEVVVSVPANAHSSQRFTTLEAFRAAGFAVRAMINEPSAAAIEFAHRYHGNLNSRRDHVLVYDLGGGTFDAALVSVAGDHHEVIDTAGIQELGGDDFDEALLELALEAADLSEDDVAHARPALLSECRDAKETLGPNTRRILIELSALGDEAPPQPIVLPAAAYYEKVRGLVDRTVQTLAEVMVAKGNELDDLKAQAAEAGVAGIYVVGGGSCLPAVPRQLRQHLGHRIHRSVYPAASTAIGLAIAADSDRDGRIAERFTRHLGVFRERDEGGGVVFDRIFAQGTPMPSQDGPGLIASRSYRAAHNIGHFRFIECASIGDDGQPCGDISPHGSISFPFDQPLLREPLDDVAVERLAGPGPIIEERYEVNAAGVIAVTLRNVDVNQERRFVL